MRFAKGHGTENDFVVVPDVDGEIKLDAEQVRALCNRRSGIGADGVLRVVRTAAEPDAAAFVGDAEWFMDYRNSDGSIAEMCGNGTRVFARYLVAAGLAPQGQWPIATRGGLRLITVPVEGDVWVRMGPVTLGRQASAQMAGMTYAGIEASVGNPHLVCIVDTPIDDLELSRPVLNSSEFPDGANVEFVNVLASGHAKMRVYERGSGETRSCGTGACAVAAVVAARAGDSRPASVSVDVPGGYLKVRLTDDDCELGGPAVLVAEGEWLG